LTKGGLDPGVIKDCYTGGVFWLGDREVGEDEVLPRGNSIVIPSEPGMLFFVHVGGHVDEVVFRHEFFELFRCSSFGNVFTRRIILGKHRVKVSCHYQRPGMEGVLEFGYGVQDFLIEFI
jgi:hypothetical protein